jgi:hypothetical protein
MRVRYKYSMCVPALKFIRPHSTQNTLRFEPFDDIDLIGYSLLNQEKVLALGQDFSTYGFKVKERDAVRPRGWRKSLC